MGKKKLDQEENLYRAKEKAAQYLKLPKDIVLGASIITMLGNHELWIENYKGLLDFKEDCILLQGKNCRIRIRGKRLEIPYYTREEMKVYGWITEVEYE
jgi:sporulation protein YqfC